MRRLFERGTYWLLVAIAALVFGVGWGRVEMAPAQAELVPSALGGGGLITHFYEDNSTNQTRVIVIDPLQKRIVVYHIEIGSGEIQLKSARNMTVDLQLQDFNSGEPSPGDMQKMLERN